MFRIKNVRNATTAKYTQMQPAQPSPPRPPPKVQKPQPVESPKKTIANATSKGVSLRPNPAGRIVGRKKESVPLNIAVTKHKLVFAHNKDHEHVQEEKRQQTVKVEEKEDQQQRGAAMTAQIEHQQKQIIIEPSVEQDTLLSRQSNLNPFSHTTQQRIDQDQQRRKQEERLKQQQLKEERRKQKEAEQRAEQLKREEQLNQVTKKIMERRKAREEERKRRQQVEQQWQRAQQAAAPGNGAMINLTDNLAHVQMSDATMDVQVALILRMKFAGYPNQQTLQQQQQQLERINQSYLMVRSEPNHPLTRGLSNFRTELFNRVGELIMQAQAQMGPSHAGMRIINADSRNYPEIRDMRITRGLEQAQMQLLLSEQQLQQAQDCAICLAEMAAGETAMGIQCGHRFHSKCLQQWLSTSASCPSCRYNIKQGRKGR